MEQNAKGKEQYGSGTTVGGDRQALDTVVNPLPAPCPAARKLRSRNFSDNG
jgi:hypothetical protein